ncbi:uncharacterized protein [Physcomitrium patens]|uniref:uncharacterized protein isoform X4 n=1 Tax=Physcomitrium patens TaxID=3218 RepID=UPI003CCD50EC
MYIYICVCVCVRTYIMKWDLPLTYALHLTNVHVALPACLPTTTLPLFPFLLIFTANSIHVPNHSSSVHLVLANSLVIHDNFRNSSVFSRLCELDKNNIISMARIEDIVYMLNKAPFNYSISFLEFSQSNSLQLQKLVLYVLSIIHPKNSQNLDSNEEKIAWMLDVLRMLNYRPKNDSLVFQQGLVDGNTNTIYPLLMWLLPQVEMLKKRAYLAPFLIDIDIPPELILEDDVNMLNTQFDMLREYFKTTHKHLQSIHKKEKNSSTLKRNVQGLEVERNHLDEQIQKFKTELQHVEKLNEYLDAIQTLRDEKSQYLFLVNQLQDQEHILAQTFNHSKVVSKLHEVQELAGSESMSAMLQKMAQACSLLHYQAEDKLPKEMEKSRLHLQALQQVLGNTDPMDPALSPIQAKLALVNDELKGLKRRNVHDHDGSGCGEGNEVQRQQLRMTSIVANKIRDAFDRLADLTKQRDMLIADLEHKFHSIEEVKGSVRRGEDLKQYVELLRGKSATYKALKKELDDKATDYGVLVRTKRLLEQQAAGDADVSTFEDGSAAVYELIQCTQRQLEQQDEISVDDSATNSSEGHEKMCKNVWKRIAELDTKLQEQRAKVAPLLKQLKEVRTTLQDIETKNAEREEKFTETSTVSKRKLAELESAVNESSKKHEDDYKQLQELNLHRERLETTLDQCQLHVYLLP